MQNILAICNILRAIPCNKLKLFPSFTPFARCYETFWGRSEHSGIKLAHFGFGRRKKLKLLVKELFSARFVKIPIKSLFHMKIKSLGT